MYEWAIGHYCQPVPSIIEIDSAPPGVPIRSPWDRAIIYRNSLPHLAGDDRTHEYCANKFKNDEAQYYVIGDGE